MDGINLTKLTARHYYLLRLNSLSIVSPSIGIPYPKHPGQVEDMILHDGRLKIQKLRIGNMKKDIKELKNKNVVVDEVLLKNLKKRFDQKINNLVAKYKPNKVRML